MWTHDLTVKEENMYEDKTKQAKVSIFFVFVCFYQESLSPCSVGSPGISF